MLVSSLRVGTQLANGRITVTALKRQGAYSLIELTSNGVSRTVRLHKAQPIATVLVGVSFAGKASGSYSVTPHKVVASSQVWRGQRGEAHPRATWDDSPRRRTTASQAVYDAPASVRADTRY